jgi:hypothetical protein
VQHVFELTLLLCLIGAGCGGDESIDDTSLPCPPTHYSCDIGQEDCAAGILDLTACVRGDEVPELPKINQLTGKQFGEQLRREAEQDDVGPSPWDPLLRALRLLPQGESSLDASIAQAVDSVAAFYDPETKEISVITDAGGENADPLDRMYVLSHEFTHFLQDRAHDLSQLDEQASASTDRQLALSMLVEGEAVVNSTRVVIRLMRHSADQFSFPRFFDALDESLLDSIRSAGSPLVASLQTLPYGVGGRYVAQVWDERGRGAVSKLFDAAPLTAADWLALDTAHPTASRSEPLDCAPPLAPPGFELYTLDHFGAAGVVAMLGSIDQLELDLPGELVDDAFALYVQEGAEDPASAPVVGVWRLRFARAASSERFYQLFAGRGIGLRRAGSELLIRVSSDDAGAILQGSELEACPALEELVPKHPAASPRIAARKHLWH